ncbi:MAG: DUF2076 domain-containing protein [Acidobacteriaceae bacterium]
MTPQERTMLSDLVGRIEGTRLPEKDSEAEDLLRQRLGQSPEESLQALYVMAQTVLVQNYALEQAKAQIDQLKRQPAPQQAANQPARATSFLGGLFGHKDEPQAQRPATSSATQPAYAPVQQSYPPAGPAGGGQGGGYPPAYGAPQGYPPAPQQGGGSSFLRSAATTAAGVAAGALAFEGVESLMHGFGHSAGFGGGGGFPGGAGMGGPGMGEETVINNYYDSPAGGPGNESGDDRLQDLQSTAQQGDAGLSPQSDLADDASVQGDDGSEQPMDLADADVDDGSSDQASLDDGNGFDDGGTFDDGGGDDSSFS